MSKSVSVAKKYAKALLDGTDEAELKSLGEATGKAAALFTMEKFIEIVKSPLVSADEKTALVKEAVGESGDKFANLLKLLGAGKRLAILPLLDREVQGEIAKRENRYEGSILSQSAVSDEEVKSLEGKLSSQLGATVVLAAQTGDYDGFKVEVPDLGVKIDFSQEKLKSQLLAHVLRGI